MDVLVAAKKPKKAAATRKRAGAKPKAKKTAKAKTARKPFGGYLVSFSGRRETLEEVFGKKPITPGEMNKRIWALIKYYGLSNK